MSGFVDNLTVEFSVPMKADAGANRLKWRILNFLAMPGHTGRKLGPDVRQSVMESFWAHGKTMDAGAIRKADNTEDLIRFLIHQGRVGKLIVRDVLPEVGALNGRR